MVLKEKAVVRSVRFALGAFTGTLLVAGIAHAQETGDAVQKIEITGSAIKRIYKEGALPVQQLNKEVIARSGATTVADLIQKLPAMQGFTPTTTAVGTNSGGRASASIHNIGESYTLVLLNGRRVAPQGSGSAVNLNAIPMSAVERVEVLTDGASALYGSDAIAGVVNFILKKNEQGGTVEAGYDYPTEGGAKSYNASLTYGFGNLEEDRYNVLISYRHDDQQQLKATDRDFAKTAYLPFVANGHNYLFDKTSAYSSPANLAVTFKDKTISGVNFNPYLLQNGNCPANHVIDPTNPKACKFDYAATLEIVPVSKRDSLFTTARFKVNQDWTLFSDVALSRYDLTARIAPNPVPVTIAPGSAYYNSYVLPYLTQAQIGSVKSVTANYRMSDWGTRNDNTITNSKHFVFGAEGEFKGWSINSAATYSQNSIDENYTGGYVLDGAFRDMIKNASFNPFLPVGQQTDATKQLIQNSLFNGPLRTASTTLKGVDTRASKEIFELPGGNASVAVGADYREYAYSQSPSSIVTSGAVYNLAAPPSYDMKRSTYGVFGEILAPVVDKVELSAATRFDQYSSIDDGINNVKVGQGNNAVTYKLSIRYQPSNSWLVRASYGTGFKAPAMLDIAQPLVRAGVTDNQACPFPGSAYCKPGNAQYDNLSGGNANLKPEKSKQFTIGARFEPSSSFSVGADLWDVQLRDQVSAVSQSIAFADPVKYAQLFTQSTEIATGNTYWAFKNLSINIGKSHNRGIDWDMTGRKNLGFGTLTGTINGTYMLVSDFTLPGTDNSWDTDLGKFGVYNNVGFRNLVSATTTLETGKFSNSLSLTYRSGYQDQPANVTNLDTKSPETITLHVPSYTTFDWQGRYSYSKTVELRAGIKNLFNKTPPMSLQTAGAYAGQQTGYDARYADSVLRTIYVTGKYKF
ncbi:TonB-dependent receptor [Undibacterium sp. Ji67W]|uniref:TonB-dependent receptor n=1 Tax=Undibacterium sp. Ji67W TaxID=3413042 RepID=UPI003BF404F2